MEVILAKSAGFCFGVRRAVKMCQDAAKRPGRVYTLGPIIHNKSVTDMLEKEGIFQISDITELETGDAIIIRSHGIGKSELEAIQSTGAEIIDATCPDVSAIHTIAREQSELGRTIVIIGQRDHPEIVAIAGWCSNYLIFEEPDKISFWLQNTNFDKSIPISVVSQTTGSRENFKLCIKLLKKECTNIKIFDTICNSTLMRQQEAADLAKIADAMIVIGGQHSANSLRLAEICSSYCKNVQFIETAGQLDVTLFRPSDIIGITAGASTPAWIIKEVNQIMCEENKIDVISEEAAPDPVTEIEESFEEMLERSIKTLYTGEKVTGIIAAITPTEVSVDLGTKQSGYIPISELTDDPNANVEELVKVGDEIETYVMRVNDVEGTVMLSKKRLDSAKNLDLMETAKDDKTVVEGTVIEENKGGVVALVKGLRVFIPASQTGLGKDVPMSTLMKSKVRLRITEVNQSRRRVVGSIRAVAFEERRAKAEQIWEEIEVGKRYKGIVKSMTTYGAFIDIGGIDGMVHVSELSWTRISQPSDVLTIGGEIEVYVVSFDKEKKKISLGYKNLEDNPWVKFTNNFNLKDVVKVKIVKLMPFGAFAEIIPGVDGLIHISQISDHRIGQPSEVLSEGQEVDVKITEIDTEKHKVSLSIRAILVPEPEERTESAFQAVEEPVDDTPVIVYDTDAPPVMDDEPEEAEVETAVEVEPEVEAPVEEAAEAE